jgi:hypothetical protein
MPLGVPTSSPMSSLSTSRPPGHRLDAARHKGHKRNNEIPSPPRHPGRTAHRCTKTSRRKLACGTTQRAIPSPCSRFERGRRLSAQAGCSHTEGDLPSGPRPPRAPRGTGLAGLPGRTGAAEPRPSGGRGLGCDTGQASLRARGPHGPPMYGRPTRDHQPGRLRAARADAAVGAGSAGRPPPPY